MYVFKILRLEKFKIILMPLLSVLFLWSGQAKVSALDLSDVIYHVNQKDINYRVWHYRYLMAKSNYDLYAMSWIPVVDFNLQVKTGKAFSNAYNYRTEIESLLNTLKLSSRGPYWKQLISGMQTLYAEVNDVGLVSNVDKLGTYLVHYLDHISTLLDKRKLRVLNKYNQRLQTDTSRIDKTLLYRGVSSNVDPSKSTDPYLNSRLINIHQVNQDLQQLFKDLTAFATVARINFLDFSSYSAISALIDKYSKDHVEDSADLDDITSVFDLTIQHLEAQGDEDQSQTTKLAKVSNRALLLHRIRHTRQQITNTKEVFRGLFTNNKPENLNILERKDHQTIKQYFADVVNYLTKQVDFISFEYGINIKYKIFDSGKYLLSNKILKHSKDISYYQYIIAKNQSIIDNIKLYLDVIMIDTEIRMLNARLADLQELLEAVKIRYEQDTIDYLALQRVLLSIDEINKKLSLKKLDRDKLVNRYLIMFDYKIDQELSLPDFFEFDFDEQAVYDNIEQHNPYVHILTAKMNIETNQSYLAISRGLPEMFLNFNWGADYNVITNKHSKPRWTGGVLLSWNIPLPFVGQSNYRSKLFDSLRVKRLARSASKKMKLQATVLLHKIKNTALNLDSTTRNIDHLEKKIKLYNIRFRQGKVTLDELLDTKLQLWQAEVSLYKDYLTKIYDTINVFALMGDVSDILNYALFSDEMLIQDASQPVSTKVFKFYKRLEDRQLRQIVDKLTILHDKTKDLDISDDQDKQSPDRRFYYFKPFKTVKRKSPFSRVIEKKDDYHWKVDRQKREPAKENTQYKKMKSVDRDYYVMP